MANTICSMDILWPMKIYLKSIVIKKMKRFSQILILMFLLISCHSNDNSFEEHNQNGIYSISLLRL